MSRYLDYLSLKEAERFSKAYSRDLSPSSKFAHTQIEIRDQLDKFVKENDLEFNVLQDFLINCEYIKNNNGQLTEKEKYDWAMNQTRLGLLETTGLSLREMWDRGFCSLKKLIDTYQKK